MKEAIYEALRGLDDAIEALYHVNIEDYSCEDVTECEKAVHEINVVIKRLENLT